MGDRMTKKGTFETWKGEEPPDGKEENKWKNKKKLKEEKEPQKGKKKDKGEQSKGKGRKEDNGASLQGGASSSGQIHDANLEQNNSGASSSRQIQDANLEQNNSEASSTRQTDDTSDSGPNSLGASSSRQIQDANLEQNNSEASSTRKTDDTNSGPNNSGASSSRQIQDANLEQNNSGDLSRRQADDADSTINPNRNEELKNTRKLSNINLDGEDIIQKVLAGAKDRELSNEERQTIRKTTDQFKDGERRRRIQALRESYPNRTGVFGPLLPPQRFIKDLGYSVRKELVVQLSERVLVRCKQYQNLSLHGTLQNLILFSVHTGEKPAKYFSQSPNSSRDTVIRVVDAAAEINEEDFGTDYSTHPSIQAILINHSSNMTTNFDFELTNSKQMKKFLSEMNTRKSCGHDLIPPRLLKDSASVVSEPLAKLLNCSINLGHYPSRWKTG